LKIYFYHRTVVKGLARIWFSVPRVYGFDENDNPWPIFLSRYIPYWLEFLH